MKIWNRDDPNLLICVGSLQNTARPQLRACLWCPHVPAPGPRNTGQGCRANVRLLLAAVRCAPTLGVFRDLHSRRTVARRLRHRAHQVPGCLQWVRGHPTIPIICSSPNLSMHEMVCQLCNTGGGDVVTPCPLLRSGSLQLTFSQSTFIMTTTASSQHNTVSLGHILCFTMGSFSSKIDWFNVRCKMPRAKQKVQF